MDHPSILQKRLEEEIAARQAVEAHFERLTRLYSALTRCNQAIVHNQNKEELFQAVCRILVEHGDMKMAWVGLLDDSGKQVTPAASFGEGEEMLFGIHITTDPDDPYGQGPSGTTIRENKPFWCTDFTNDPRLAPWRDRIEKYGWRATVTVPICFRGTPIGAFSMYSDHPREFDAAAGELMIRLGKDISHAIDHYALEAERRHNDALLRGDSIETLRERDNALKEITQGVAIADTQRIVTYVNDAFTRTTGYAPEEIIGKRCAILQGKETSRETVLRMRELLNAARPFAGEVLNYRKDGSTFWNYLTVTPVLDPDGKLKQWVGIQRDITEQKQAHARIQRLNQLYAALSHCNHAIVHSTNLQELLHKICQGAVEHGGMMLAWIGLVNKTKRCIDPVAVCGKATGVLTSIDMRLDATSRNGLPISATAIVQKQPIWCQDLQAECVEEKWCQAANLAGLHSMAALPLFKEGEVVGNFSIFAAEKNAFDEEARKLLEEMSNDVSFALVNFEKESRLRLAAKVFEQSNESLFVANASRKIELINKAFTAMTGARESDILGKDFRSLFLGQNSEEIFQTILLALEKNAYWQGEVWNLKRTGEPFLEWLSISAVRDAEGNLTNYVGTSNDITQRKHDKERMDWLSHFDPLTGLPNRTLLEDRCQQALTLTQSTKESLALLYLDLDHFKQINDSFGHPAGDQILLEAATRLERLVREQDTLARLSADEFIIVAPGLSSTDAAHFAERMLSGFTRPFFVDDHELNISASIGIAMSPLDGKNFNDLLKCADMAMSRAKQDGRNDFCFFMPEIHAQSTRALQLENALRRALERKQLTLLYQPQISLADGKIIGAEALLRWHHPDFGLVPPAEFIPIAESSGLVLPIGEWVMRQAALQAKAWQMKGHPPFSMAVNLSPVQFRQAELPDLVTRILEETGLPPQHFELELTESTAMENPEMATAILNALHTRGVRTALDDFGTGYSSLAYLKRFRLHKLKIDRSFVQGLGENAEDRTLIRTIINMASNLGMETTAEGVERKEQLAILKESGCDFIQGFYFSRPMTAEHFELYMQKKPHF